MYIELENIYNQVENIVEKLDSQELKTLTIFLKDRIINPDSFVVFLGETSGGKSTIINGLLEEYLLHTGAAPTTGSVIEIMLDSDVVHPRYQAICQNGTVLELDYSSFTSQSKKADVSLQRLRVIHPFINEGFQHMRIFDTPGYGSIIKEHEEVIKSFVPNSDVIVYVINYKIGIQEDDFIFLRFMQELIRDDAEIVTVINRCPAGVDQNDSRVVEIVRYVNDILHRKTPLFLLMSERNSDANGNSLDPLPKATQLWEHIVVSVNSEERQAALKRAFKGFINDLLDECDFEINKRLYVFKLSREDRDDIKRKMQELMEKIQHAKSAMVIPNFERLQKKVPELFALAEGNIVESVQTKIREDSVFRKEEIVAYVNRHLLPHRSKMETQEIKRYLEVELDALDEQVNQYLEQAITDFEKDITLSKASMEVDILKGVARKIGSRFLESSLSQFFIQFGGRGGVGAGVANAAKHGLKKIGDLFGKTFSRETHNTLAQFLKKVGATSAKAVGVAVAVVIEFASMVYDVATWKMKLCKAVAKGTSKWKESALEMVSADLEKLKQNNIENLDMYCESIKSTFLIDELPASGEVQLMIWLDEIKKIRNELEGLA